MTIGLSVDSQHFNMHYNAHKAVILDQKCGTTSLLKFILRSDNRQIRFTSQKQHLSVVFLIVAFCTGKFITRPLHVDCIGNTALHLACIAGLPEVAEALVQKGANVSASVSVSSNSGYSALQV
jgi:Ankyrin repeat